MDCLEVEVDARRLREMEDELEGEDTARSEIGDVGLGQVRSLDRLDVQNYQILLYKYHCRWISNPLGMISGGSFPCGIGCRRISIVISDGSAALS